MERRQSTLSRQDLADRRQSTLPRNENVAMERRQSTLSRNEDVAMERRQSTLSRNENVAMQRRQSTLPRNENVAMERRQSTLSRNEDFGMERRQSTLSRNENSAPDRRPSVVNVRTSKGHFETSLSADLKRKPEVDISPGTSKRLRKEEETTPLTPTYGRGNRRSKMAFDTFGTPNITFDSPNAVSGY